MAAPVPKGTRPETREESPSGAPDSDSADFCELVEQVEIFGGHSAREAANLRVCACVHRERAADRVVRVGRTRKPQAENVVAERHLILESGVVRPGVTARQMSEAIDARAQPGVPPIDDLMEVVPGKDDVGIAHVNPGGRDTVRKHQRQRKVCPDLACQSNALPFRKSVFVRRPVKHEKAAPLMSVQPGVGRQNS